MTVSSSNVSAILQYALSRGFQVNPDALELLDSTNLEKIQRVIKEIVKTKSGSGEQTISGIEIASALGIVASDEPFENKCEIVSDPTSKTASAEGVEGYGKLFINRYEKMLKIMSSRNEAKLFKKIATIKNNGAEEEAYTCGLVWKRIAATQDRPGRLVLEDPTGTIELMVPYTKEGDDVGMLMSDQFVMVRIINAKGGFIAKQIDVPDIARHLSNKSQTDVYAIFLSDLHVGSKYFMEKEFDDFLSWLTSNEPIAARVGYILICGDSVDGAGIYPNQNKELVLQTVEEQFAHLDELVAKIPEKIKIIINPGNHDPGRQALPQPAIPRKYAQALWKRPNVTMVGNPATVWLNGVRVLMYHGQSIDDVVKVTPNLSYEKPLGVMKHLLRARHLSPIYGGGTPIAPESEDMMVIDNVPDIFHAGHVHVAGAENYRGVIMINSGTWQSKTPFQENVRMEPTPGQAIMINLKTFVPTTRVFV